MGKLYGQRIGVPWKNNSSTCCMVQVFEGRITSRNRLSNKTTRTKASVTAAGRAGSLILKLTVGVESDQRCLLGSMDFTSVSHVSHEFPASWTFSFRSSHLLIRDCRCQLVSQRKCCYVPPILLSEKMFLASRKNNIKHLFHVWHDFQEKTFVLLRQRWFRQVLSLMCKNNNWNQRGPRCVY